MTTSQPDLNMNIQEQTEENSEQNMQQQGKAKEGEEEEEEERGPRLVPNEVSSSVMRRFWDKIVAATFARFLPMIGYHHILMMIGSVAATMLSLVMAGCSSTRMRGVYLYELSYQTSSGQGYPTATLNQTFYDTVSNMSITGDLTVRVGYFGLCIRSSEMDWTCASGVKHLTHLVTGFQDPLNLLAIGKVFEDKVFLSVLSIMSIILLFIEMIGLGTFPGWHEETDAAGEEREVKPFPSRPVSHFCFAVNMSAVLLQLVAILWQHVAAVAQTATIQGVFNNVVKTKIGAAAMALGWVGLFLQLVVCLGIAFMILSINLIMELTEEEE